MEVESLSLRAVGSFSYDFDKDKPLPKHIDMVQASDLIEAKGFVAIQVSDRPTPLIKGMNNFSSHHGSEVIQFAASQNGEGIVLFSNFVFPAYKLAQEIETLSPSYKDKIYVVSTSALSSLSGSASSHGYVYDFLEAKYHVLSKPTSHPITQQKSKLTRFKTFGESKAVALQDVNVIVAGGNDLLNTYVSYGSIPLSVPLILTMKDKEWEGLGKALDLSKPTYVAFGDVMDNDLKQLITNYVSWKVNSHVNVGKLLFTTATERVAVLPSVSTDNDVTLPHRNSDTHLAPNSLYALQQHHGAIQTVCFSQSCTDRAPSSNSSYGTTLINTNEVFSIDNFRIAVDTSSLDKNKPTVFVVEDTATALLGFMLAQEMSEEGVNILGFSSLFGGVFGGMYENPSDKGGDTEFYLNGIQSPLDVKLRTAIFSTTPQSPIEITTVMLLLIGFSLSILMLAPHRYGFIKAISGCVFMYLSVFLNFWFILPAEAYGKPLLPTPLLSVAVSWLLYSQTSLTTNRQKVSFLLAVNALMLWVVAFSITLPMDRLLWGRVAGGGVVHWALKSRYCVSEVGEKYSNTCQFVNGFHGYLLPFGGRISKPKSLFSSKWIVRSNHLCKSESLAGGIFESKIATPSELNKTIAELELNATKLHNLTPEQVQFWVMPFKEYDLAGCVESHYGSSSLLVSYALGKEDAVTDGQESIQHFIDRTNPKTKLEKAILLKLSLVEMVTDMPVMLEIGVKGNTVDVLQVREQKLHESADSSNLALWRNNHKRMAKVEQGNHSPLTCSVLHQLFSKSVSVGTEEGSYRLIDSPVAFDETIVRRVVNELKEMATNRDVLTRAEFSQLCSMVSACIEPVVSMNSDEASVDDRTLLSLIDDTYEAILVSVGCIPESFELRDNDFSFLPKTQLITPREAVRAVVLFGIAIVKTRTKQMPKSALNCSTDSIARGTQSCQPPSIPNPTGHYEIVVVAGSMPEKSISVDEFHAATLQDPDSLNDVTLVCDYVPQSLMQSVHLLGGICCSQGTTLSHLALTAKAYNVPMVIRHNPTPCRL